MLHGCRWPGCRRRVPITKWGCRGHWFRLPKRLRELICLTYRVGPVSHETRRARRDTERQVRGWLDQEGATTTNTRAGAPPARA
jgi:hypothetical protein